MSMITRIRGHRTRPLLLAGALLSIVLGAALGVRESVRARRAQRQAAEHTVRDYANFAAYLYTTRAYLFARDRALFGAYVPVHPSDPWIPSKLPPPSVLAAMPDPAKDWPIYRFRLDLDSRALTFAPGYKPTGRILQLIQDSVPRLAKMDFVRRAGFGYLFVENPREAIAFGTTMDSSEKPLAVYGYRS